MIKNTLIRTPTGSKAISDIKAGDFVCNEFGKPVRVRQVTCNGPTTVVDLLVFGKPWATCAKEHRWLVKEGCNPKDAEVKSVSDFNSATKIITRVEGQPFGFGMHVTVGMERTEDTFALDVDADTSFCLLSNGLVTHTKCSTRRNTLNGAVHR